jgi:hypothetical protein
MQSAHRAVPVPLHLARFRLVLSEEKKLSIAALSQRSQQGHTASDYRRQ